MSTLRLSEADERSGATYSEKDLDGRLSNPNDASEADGAEKDEAETLAQTDFQLFEALNLLKGLHILNGISSS